MRRHDIIRILNKLHKKLDETGAELKKDLEEEPVHYFRVTFKKLRSFTCMLCAGHAHDDKLKIHTELRNYYRLLGGLRDLQLLHTRLSSERFDKDLEHYINVINQKILEKKHYVRNVSLKGIVSRSRDRLAKYAPDSFNLVNVELFRDDQWRLIRNEVKDLKGSVEGIHSVRKTLKDLYYVTTILRSASQPLYQTDDWQGKDETFFIQLMKELGDYHDICIAIDLLSNAPKTFSTDETPASLQNIYRKWMSQKSRQGSRLLNKLKTQIFPELNPSERIIKTD